MKIAIQSHNIINAARHIQFLGEMFNVGVINPYATFEILLKAEREANRRATKECNEAILEEDSDKWWDNFNGKLMLIFRRKLKPLILSKKLMMLSPNICASLDLRLLK